MNEQELLEGLKLRGSLLSGHFLLSSGLHSATYMEKAYVIEDPLFAEQTCGMIAGNFTDPHEVEVVVSPALGAIVLGFQVALILSKMHCHNVAFVPAEKNPNNTFFFRPAYQKKLAGKRVLVVEDVWTTGGSTLRTMNAIRENGGEVVAAAALCNRGGKVTSKELGGVERAICLTTLPGLDLTIYKPDECPMCKEGIITLVKPGSSKAA